MNKLSILKKIIDVLSILLIISTIILIVFMVPLYYPSFIKIWASVTAIFIVGDIIVWAIIKKAGVVVEEKSRLRFFPVLLVSIVGVVVTVIVASAIIGGKSFWKEIFEKIF